MQLSSTPSEEGRNQCAVLKQAWVSLVNLWCGRLIDAKLER